MGEETCDEVYKSYTGTDESTIRLLAYSAVVDIDDGIECVKNSGYQTSAARRSPFSSSRWTSEKATHEPKFSVTVGPVKASIQRTCTL